MSSDQKPRDSSATGALIIGAIFAVWLFVVLLSGNGINITGIEWDFERTGQLGDSFGFLSALMATFAAMFALQTLEKERAKTARLAEREQLQDQAEIRREAETTFFKLLDFRNTIVADISLRHGSGKVSTGTDALESIYNAASSEISFALHRGDSLEDAFKGVYGNYQNDLGHYFRFTYHIVRFISERFDKERSYEYARILRAQLSNSEQALIAMNCAYGEGKAKFKPLVEQLSLLHNLSDSDIASLDLARRFEPEAFERKQNASVAK